MLFLVLKSSKVLILTPWEYPGAEGFGMLDVSASQELLGNWNKEIVSLHKVCVKGDFVETFK